MKTSTTIITIASLLSTTLALPKTTHTLLSTANPPTWSVTNYTSGCSPAACVYTFNITTNPTPSYPPSQYPEPSFSTFCQGNDIQDKLVACDDPSVSANEVPGVSNVTVVIQHKWQQPLAGDEGDVGTFWIVGNYTLVDPVEEPASFEVPQLEEFAIA